MHENKFEKQVQEKMNGLGFQPREELWANVDREINKEKKWKPIFWIFFFSGLMLAAGGIFYTLNKNISTKYMQPLSPAPDQKKENQTNTKNGEKISNPNPSAPPNAVMVLWQRAYQNRSEKRKQILAENETEIKTAGLTAQKEVEQTPAGQSKDVSNVLVPRALTDSGNIVSKTQSASEVKKIFKDSAAIPLIPPTEKKKSKSWQIGFTAGAGISSINQGLFNSTPVYASNSSITPGSGSTGGPAYSGSSSDINPGFSFQAGLFASRNLTDRFSLSAGFSYHYYSTRIQTGNFANGSFILLGSTLNSYYDAGNSQSHTNQYHFIEMPVNFDFQLNKSQRLPLYWELGLSPSWLISSNTLQFYPFANAYIKDGGVFNKFQLNASTSILIGMKTAHGEVRLGPQLQYGITNLLKSGEGDSEHLLYGGLKIVFLPIKK